MGLIKSISLVTDVGTGQWEAPADVVYRRSGKWVQQVWYSRYTVGLVGFIGG